MKTLPSLSVTISLTHDIYTLSFHIKKFPLVPQPIHLLISFARIKAENETYDIYKHMNILI